MRLKPEERYPDARSLREALESVALKAGLPVGPGSLADYVRDEGEAVSVATSSPRRVRGGATAASPVVTAASRAAVSRLPGGPKVWAPVAGVVVGLALSLGGAALVFSRQEPVLVAPPAPVAEASMPPVAEAPEPVPAPPDAQEVEAAPEARPEPRAAEEVAAPEPPSRSERTKREPKRVRQQGPVAEAPAPAPVEEELVGEGSLILGTTPGMGGQVKLPGRELEELPLVLRRWKAGRYTLRFVTSGGAATCEVKVLPERRTRVVFDGKDCKSDLLN
jgi:hypothetical protein